MDTSQLKRWKFIHRRANGTYLGQIDKLFDWDCSRGENEKGSFSMTIPGNYLHDFNADDIIEFWRSWDNGRSFSLVDDTCWFVRDCDYTANGKQEVITLSGHDTTGLLDRRIVAWWSTATAVEGDNTYSRKSEPADAVVWDLFNENFGTGVSGVLSTDVPPSAGGPVGGAIALAAVPTDRTMQLIAYGAKPVAAPIINIEFAWKNVFSAMKDAAKMSAQNDRRLIFDIVYDPNQSPPFRFHIWLDRRGSDRGIVFSQEHENVSKISLKKIFSDEVTWVHVGGSGQGNLRVVQGVIAPPAIFKRSPFYPIESFVEATKNADYLTLKSAGDSELYRKRARYSFSADAKDSPQTVYGRDYKLGDTVTAKHRGIVATCRVSKSRISLKNGQEQLSIPLESADDLSDSSAN